MGAVKKPLNIFRLGNLGEPHGVFNWRLWFAVINFALLGAARGIDEGLITGAFNSEDFQRRIHFSSYSTTEQADIKGNVSSMVLVGSIGGSLFAFLVCDRIGRLWATRELCVLWIVGIAIFMGSNGNLGAVYAGRLIAGFGIGQTPVVGPIYLAEIAPASVRGLCTCLFTAFVYLGVLLAYFANYGAQVHLGGAVPNRWIIPTSLHIMFAGIIFCLSWFQYESPRYLVKKGHIKDAIETMSRLRHLPEDHPYLQHEINGILVAHEAEASAVRGMTLWGTIKETLGNKNNAYRLYLSTSVQFLSQWSGAGSITLYAPDLFKLLGLNGTQVGLLVSAVFGIVKLVSSLVCALFLVDVIGRKRALLLGIVLQTIAMVYVAGFLTAVPQLGHDEHYQLPHHLLGASYGAIAMIYLSGCGWALGWNSMQYLLTAELYPLNIRALATSWTMSLHYANQYGNTRAVPNLLLPVNQGGITAGGTFWSFAAITIIGGVWVWFFVPETGGRTLESMDRLFDLPWYQIGRYGNRDAAEKDEQEERERIDKLEGVEGKEEAGYVEEVSRHRNVAQLV